jgi:hypothetical protein
MFRLRWMDRAVIQSNDLGPGRVQNGHILYLPGPGFDDSTIAGGQYTNRVVIADNIIRPGDDLNWTVYVGPQNISSDERFRDYVIERNLFLPGGAAQQMALVVSGDVQGLSIRDNLFAQGNSASSCVRLIQGGLTQVFPQVVDVSHNTCSGTDGPRLIRFDPASGGVRAFNNLIVGPVAAVSDSPLAAEAGNLALTPAAAGLVSATPAVAADFALTMNSPARDVGDATHRSLWDYLGQPRGASPDVGALEYSAE